VTPPFDPETVVVGILGRPHGVRGEISLRLYNEGSDALDGVSSLILERDGARTTHVLEGVRPGGQALRPPGVPLPRRRDWTMMGIRASPR